MQRETPETIIATIPKNGSEEIRVRLNEYRRDYYVDLRVFAAFKSDDPERQPTKKGVSVHIGKLDELMDALVQARAEAERQGLLKHSEEQDWRALA
ncbi:hypothetical protein KBI52_12290 [Microvirga sp. HBU67558]|uniref:PC4/YdbC family ssDNA-binding protein n=1 Tax=Microvirga sp. HBU67558 TaxID=2824562 RepID=UPI001B383853|nr:PC4/YdbC family ssDNA-binding protein [Microvirga sp. HBU67558]MBQ0820986.1 hypothetical protein [Microvirga sp. HBU67558]